ncbi:MAG: hypothetical protein IPM54_44635 [Polyangiaceae bacterium]|nr:hypothetical protein [Polyangiaceae bacterium]
MHLTLDLPDDLVPAKPLDEIARELLRAGAMYWLVRGEISAEQAKAITASDARDESFKALLMSMPDVGDDVDFERAVDLGRSEGSWDT